MSDLCLALYTASGLVGLTPFNRYCNVRVPARGSGLSGYTGLFGLRVWCVRFAGLKSSFSRKTL